MTKVTTFTISEPPHDTSGAPCWCGPRVERVPGAGDIVIHRALDEIIATACARERSLAEAGVEPG